MSIPLHLREYGAGDTVVLLLHGLFGSSANWGSVARYLAEDHTVLVPDLRNHGQSPHNEDVSYAAMASDLLALLDYRQVDRTVIVGHSMGGKVAMQLALHEPQRVSGLAVVDMSPVAYRHDFEQVFDACAAVDLVNLQKRADADAQMAPFLLEPGIRAFLQQNLHRAGDGWAWRCNLEALRAGQGLITGFEASADTRYMGPASFIHGSDSDYVQRAHEPTIARLFPNAILCEVPAAGHWVYAENPAGFTRCLEGFLRSLPPQPRS